MSYFLYMMMHESITFWYGQKADEDKSVTMCMTYIVEEITNRSIDRPIFIMTCTDQNSSLVAPNNNRNKHSTVCIRIFGDLVLRNKINKYKLMRNTTYLQLLSMPSFQT